MVVKSPWHFGYIQKQVAKDSLYNSMTRTMICDTIPLKIWRVEFKLTFKTFSIQLQLPMCVESILYSTSVA